MKNITFILLSGLLLYSCSKEEPLKLTAYNTEVYTLDMDSGREVHALTRVKGFEQKEQGKNKFVATIAYDLDLIIPKGDTLKSFISQVEDKDAVERMTDAGLEAQFELDSTYAMGEYKVIFIIKDVLSGNKAFTSASFKIENE